MDIIKVKANSRTAAVAGAIAGVIREHKRAEVQAIGAGEVRQTKALVLAKGYLAETAFQWYVFRSSSMPHIDELRNTYHWNAVFRQITFG